MNREWFSAKELAGLPGLPGTVQRINALAKRRGWQWRPRKGRGGGREYHLASLPDAARTHLAGTHAQAAVSAVVPSQTLEQIEAAARARDEAARQAKAEGLREFAAMPEGKRKQRILARRHLVESLWAFRRTYGGSKEISRAAFCEAVNAGEIDMPGWVVDLMPKYRGIRHLTEPTLHRWELAYQSRGIMALGDHYGNRRGGGKIDTNQELQAQVLGCVLKYPHITPDKVCEYLRATHPDLPTVSSASVRRFVKRWKNENKQAWELITNPDRWKNVYMAAFGSHFDAIDHINQLWEMDSTPADWMLKDGRHSVIGVIDLYSRRLKFRVSKTSKAEAVCLIFRDAVLDWGVPDAVRTDNGKDYVAERFNSVLLALEIRHELCLPFASEQKGTIERAMRTMSHGILDLLPGFIGHSVADRKVIEARKSFADRIMDPDAVIEVELTAEELQQRLDQWCEHAYGKDPHAGLDGRSPFEVAAGQRVRRINDTHALDLLLAEVAGTRRVVKKGVRLDHHYYTAPELVMHIGSEVRLRRDPDDIGRIYVYGIEGGFICLAECDAILGISPAEKAAAAKALQKRLLAEQRAELKAAMRAVKQNPADAILAHRIAESEKLTAFPGPSETYTTPALEQAGEAHRASLGTDAPRNTQPEVIDFAAFRDEFEAHNQQVQGETDLRRIHAQWLRIEAQIERGEPVSESERLGLEGYRQSGQYQSMQELFEAFGLTAEDF